MVAFYIYIVVLYLFYISHGSQTHFCFALRQGIIIQMRMQIRGTLKMVIETSKTTNFQACFFYIAFLYWLTNLLISITFLYQ